MRAIERDYIRAMVLLRDCVLTDDELSACQAVIANFKHNTELSEREYLTFLDIRPLD